MVNRRRPSLPDQHQPVRIRKKSTRTPLIICLVIVIAIIISILIFSKQTPKQPNTTNSTTTSSAAPTPSPTNSNQPYFTYTVKFKLTADDKAKINKSDVKQEIAEIYADVLGWSKAGFVFKYVTQNPDFTININSNAYVPELARGTGSHGKNDGVSITNGNQIYINVRRWLNGSDLNYGCGTGSENNTTCPNGTPSKSWNASGGTLVNYRAMVINHETGHWLLGSPAHVFNSSDGIHENTDGSYCSKKQRPAPLMQQQTKFMANCLPNPYPSKAEIKKISKTPHKAS